MKKAFFLFLLNISFISFGQSSDNCENGTLKATYIICNSSPKDTNWIFNYSYYPDKKLDKIEKYHKGKIFSIEKYEYGVTGKLSKIIEILPQTKKSLCGDHSLDSCLEYFNKKIVEYDSINKIYYLITSEREIKQKSEGIKRDSIYQDSLLIAILSGNDTLHTYQYDNNNRLLKQINYRNNEIIHWISYQYDRSVITERYYSLINEETPSIIVATEYNNLDQMIKRVETYHDFEVEIQPKNNYKMEKFEYTENGRIKTYELFDNYVDPCMNMYCCGRYKKIYEYED